MKELSIEEKAKAYDKVREKIAVRFGTDVAEGIFSEFEESEDERIRKALIKYFKNFDSESLYIECLNEENIIDWLEKQSEQKPNPYSGTSFEYNGHTWGMCARDNGVDILCDKHIIGHLDKQGQTYTKRDVDDAWLKGMCDAKRELEKQGEQKPIIEMKSAEESLDISSKEYNDIVNDCLCGEPKPVDARENLTLDGDLMEADCMIVEQKSSWSKEDDAMLNSIIEDFGDGKTSNMLQEYWLKSLKERIGG